MKDENLTKTQLMAELKSLRRRVFNLEKNQAESSYSDEASQENEKKYKTLYDNAPLPYQFLDENGCFIDVNSTWLKTLGYMLEEVIGKWFGDFLHPDEKTHFEKIFPTFKQHGYLYDAHFKIRHKDGHYIDVSYEGSAIYYPDGRFKQTYCILQDITERRQTEQVMRRAQKMDAIGQLTSGIAHNFNNILCIILGNLDMFKYHINDEEKVNKRLESIRNSAQRAVDLTKQLLEFSRSQAAHVVVTSINEMIGEMESFIKRAVTPEVEVVRIFDKDLWFTEIEPGDFHDALLNIIINAHDAMSGGGRLTLATSNCILDVGYCVQNPGVTPGEYVQLAVNDNGQGILSEVLEHIFEPFFTTKGENGKALDWGWLWYMVSSNVQGDMSMSILSQASAQPSGSTCHELRYKNKLLKQ